MSKINSANLVNHLGLVRLSIVGEGELQIRAITYNNKASKEIAPKTLTEDEDNILESKANFKKQYMQLDIRVADAEEWFRLTELTPYLKPVAASLPG